MDEENPLLGPALREMARNPDAHMALEMIDNITADTNVHAIIAAYFEALEN